MAALVYLSLIPPTKISTKPKTVDKIWQYWEVLGLIIDYDYGIFRGYVGHMFGRGPGSVNKVALG